MKDEEIGQAVDEAVCQNDKDTLVKLYIDHHPFILDIPAFMKKKVPNNNFPDIPTKPNKDDVRNFLMSSEVSCKDIAYAGW